MEKKKTILVVDDEKLNRTIMAESLQSDYNIILAKNGEQALQYALTEDPPDIILLDILMPNIDGYEVCRQLKANAQSAQIPLFFVTSMDEIGNETMGFELGAADYIIKPVNPSIMKARINTHIKLSEALKELKQLYNTALDANPKTGLPGNNSITEHIENALQDGTEKTVLYCDIDNFKAFNDTYGFLHGDSIITFMAELLKQSITFAQVPDNFIGHIGGDDFILLVDTNKAITISDFIITRFDEGIKHFYSKEDLANNGIEAMNREGDLQVFPFMTLSIAGVDLSKYEEGQYLLVNDSCVDLKHRAKHEEQSCIFFDRREKP